MFVGDVRCATTRTGCSWIVVGRQPVVLGADERLEERPGLAGELPEKDASGRAVSRASRAGERPADPPGDGGRERTRGPGGARPPPAPPASERARRDQRGDGDDRGDPHGPAGAGEARAADAARAVRVAGRVPLEKPPVRDQHPPDRAHDRIEAEKRLVRETGERDMTPGRERRPAARPTAARCCRRCRSSGFPSRSSREAISGGITRIPTTDSVQNQGDGRTVQPSSSSSVNAGGTRLRRRLSKSFQRDSAESGFFAAPPVGPGHARQQPARQLPVPANPAVPAAHVRAVAAGILLVHLTSLSSPARA